MPIVNIRKRRIPNFSGLRINWGSGKLSGFESFYSFAAKFCRLNQLNPHQFRKFWLSLFSMEIDDYQTRAKKISVLLDEPSYLIGTVFFQNYVNSKWPQFTRHEFDFCPEKISFCRLCLAEGYHASFHEHEWLNKCPIHRIGLTQHEIPYSSHSKSDRYLLCLMSLFDLNCPNWYLIEGKYRQVGDVYKNKWFYDYLDWLLRAASIGENYVDLWIAEIGCNQFATSLVTLKRSQYFIILDKLRLIDSIPSYICDLFVETNEVYEAIDIKKFNINKSFNLRFKLIDYIIDFLISIKNNKIQSYLYWLREEIDALQLFHSPSRCDCVWGLNKRGELIHCLSGELQYLGDYMCPYEFAANELSERWMYFYTDANPFLQKLDFYRPLDVIFSSNLADEKESFLDHYQASFEINRTEQMTLLIDVIMRKIVQANIDELRYWLISIKEGESPANRKRFRPNIYLFQNENTELKLISWPAVHDANSEHRSDLGASSNQDSSSGDCD